MQNDLDIGMHNSINEWVIDGSTILAGFFGHVDCVEMFWGDPHIGIPSQNSSFARGIYCFGAPPILINT
jgi:hypothetical protein